MQNWIELVELAGIDDHDVAGGLVEYTWGDLVERLSAHERRAYKRGPCFLPVSMKPQSQWRLSATTANNPTFRNAENVASITLAVIDMDQPGAFDLAKERFAAFDYVAYTTHSYSEKEPWKWRMVIRLDEPIPASEWKGLYAGLIDGMGADPSCCHPAALFFLPSHNPTSGAPALVEVNKGRPLTQKEIIAMVPERQAKSQVTATVRRLTGSGQVVGEHRRQRTALDYTWEAFCQRNGGAIVELQQTNSRHQFALRVIATEMSASGADFNPAWTVEFIAMAAKEYSKKALHAGNTPTEIPGMILSAAEKFAPEWLAKHKSLIGLKRSLENVVRTSVERSRLNKNSLHQASASNPNATAYWWYRHDIACRNLLADGNLRAFGMAVYQRELDLAGDSTDLNKCGEFVFYAARRYLIRQGQLPPTEQVAKLEILASDLISADFGQLPWPRGDVWLRSSVKLGLASNTSKRPLSLQMSSRQEQEAAP